MFSAPTKNRTALFAMFQNRAKTLVFTMFSQQPKKQVWPKHRYLRHFGNKICPKCCILQCFLNTFSKTLVFTVFCENTCTKHRKYLQIQRLHFPWQKAKTSKNTGNYNVSEQRFFLKRVIFQLFSVWNASQKQEGGYPPKSGTDVLQLR